MITVANQAFSLETLDSATPGKRLRLALAPFPAFQSLWTVILYKSFHSTCREVSCPSRQEAKEILRTRSLFSKYHSRIIRKKLPSSTVQRRLENVTLSSRGSIGLSKVMQWWLHLYLQVQMLRSTTDRIWTRFTSRTRWKKSLDFSTIGTSLMMRSRSKMDCLTTSIP